MEMACVRLHGNGEPLNKWIILITCACKWQRMEDMKN